MSVGSSFVLLSQLSTFFSLVQTRGQTSTSSDLKGNRLSLLTLWYHNSHIFLLFALWSGNPHQGLWQSLLPPLLNGVKVLKNKGCSWLFAGYTQQEMSKLSCMALRAELCWVQEITLLNSSMLPGLSVGRYWEYQFYKQSLHSWNMGDWSWPKN